MISLLGYCYYMMSDFLNAAKMYEELVKVTPSYLRLYPGPSKCAKVTFFRWFKVCPEVEEYKIYYAQSLYKVLGTVSCITSVPSGRIDGVGEPICLIYFVGGGG